MKNKPPRDKTQPLPAAAAEQRDPSTLLNFGAPTRRDVLKAGVATALLSGSFAGVSLGALAGQAEKAAGRNPGQTREKRDLLFNLSRADAPDAEFILVAGKQRLKISPTPAGVLKQLRRQHPVLERVPDGLATHYVSARLPAAAIQLCYVQRVRKGSSHQASAAPGCGPCATRGQPWDMVLQFIHVPSFALRAASDRVRGNLGAGEDLPVPGKWRQFGLTGADLAALDDPVGLEVFMDSNDTASSMLALHPELVSGDPTSHAYIQQTIIGVQPQTAQLAQLIDAQGPIEPQANWSGCDSPIVHNSTGYGTNVPMCNPDTGAQAVNSAGQLQYIPIYSSLTNQAAQGAITPALQSLKADPTLGANDTQSPDEADGVIYRYADGTPTSDQSTDGLGAGSGLTYTTRDYSPGQGYSVEVTGVASGDQTTFNGYVTLQVRNWYVRTLGLYVRYLDGDGIPLSVQKLIGNGTLDVLQEYFPLQNAVGSLWNTDYDCFLDVLPPEKEYLGIPTKTPVKTLTIPVPTDAVSFELLASGMGNTSRDSNIYDATTVPGATMTGLFNLSLPGLFLILNAAAGAGKMSNALSSSTSTILSIFPLVMDLFADTFQAIGFDDPAAFEKLGKSVGQTLFTSAAPPLLKFVVTYLTEGETQEDLLDAIPIVGGFMAMVFAMGTVATIAESSTQVLQSPSTYRFEVTLTHDIDVVITGDPRNAGIWPSEATSFKVVLVFDNLGTPTTLELEVPAQTVDSQTASFKAVPLGGFVGASVQVCSDTGFQLAQASDGPLPNFKPATGDPLVLNLQLTENPVPLTASTVYSHKEVITLDADGKHVWTPTTTPPVQEAAGCNPSTGQLCQLTGITVNTTAGAVGQSYQSANDAVVSCTSGAGGQLHQFSNLSVTADPESGFFNPPCGFTAPPRVAYDQAVNRPDYNFYLDSQTTGPGFAGVIRQIRLSSTDQGFDGPESNKAWGKLQFPSNAFLLHPGGKIISVNSTHNKIEVVTLPTAAGPDDQAPISQAYGGKGLREGLMNGPTLATLAPDGTVLVLEAGGTSAAPNGRIQAFDLNANPSQRFGVEAEAYFFPLKQQAVTQYLDFSVEFGGYIYVLWVNRSSGTPVYTLDIYDPKGEWLTSTPNFEATRMAVSYFRDVYTQNFQVLRLPNGTLPARTEPSISHWIPSTPTA